MKRLVVCLFMALLCSCWDGVYKPTTGKVFDYEKAQKIKVGDSKESIVAVLGAPSTVTRLAERVEQWRYVYVLERESGIALGVRISTSTHQRKREAVFRIRDGRVEACSVTDELL